MTIHQQKGITMADTVKKAESGKAADTTTEPESKTAETLIDGFGRESHQRESHEVHYYTFEDGTSAKVWQDKGDSHVNVQVRDLNGRGTSNSTTLGLTVNAANKLIESAGQKAIDAKAVEGS